MKENSKDQYIPICPECKSTDVQMDTSNPLQGSMGIPSMMICNNCGYTNIVFPEIAISELDKLKEE